MICSVTRISVYLHERGKSLLLTHGIWPRYFYRTVNATCMSRAQHVLLCQCFAIDTVIVFFTILYRTPQRMDVPLTPAISSVIVVQLCRSSVPPETTTIKQNVSQPVATPLAIFTL